jgi:hypothetical protein
MQAELRLVRAAVQVLLGHRTEENMAVLQGFLDETAPVEDEPALPEEEQPLAPGEEDNAVN